MKTDYCLVEFEEHRVNFFQLGQSGRYGFKPYSYKARKASGMIQQEGKAGKAFTRSLRQSTQNLDRGGIGWRDNRSRPVSGYGTYRIHKLLKFRTIADQKPVHRFHPRLFISKRRHVCQALQCFGDQSQSTLGTRARMIYFFESASAMVEINKR